MLTYDDIEQVLQRLIHSEIVISPWLVSANGTSRFCSGAFERLAWEARDFVNLNLSAVHEIRAISSSPMPKYSPHMAIYETDASKAMYSNVQREETFEVSEATARKVFQIVGKFILKCGIAHFLRMYGMGAAYDNF